MTQKSKLEELRSELREVNSQMPPQEYYLAINEIIVKLNNEIDAIELEMKGTPQSMSEWVK